MTASVLPDSPLTGHCLTLKLTFLFHTNKEFWHPCSGHHSLSVIITQLYTRVLDILSPTTYGPPPRSCMRGIIWRPLYFFHARTWRGIGLILGLLIDMAQTCLTHQKPVVTPMPVRSTRATPQPTSSIGSQRDRLEQEAS